MDVFPTAPQDELFESSHWDFSDFLPLFLVEPSHVYTVYNTQCTLVLLDGDRRVDTSVYKCYG